MPFACALQEPATTASKPCLKLGEATMSGDQVSRSGSDGREVVLMLAGLLSLFPKVGNDAAAFALPWDTWGAVPPDKREQVRELVQAGVVQSDGEAELKARKIGSEQLEEGA